MIGDDDFDTFYDPDDFGTEARLIGDDERTVCGLLLKGGKFNKLWRDPGGKGGIKAQQTSLRFQLPSMQVPVDYQDYVLRVEGADYSITDVEPAGTGRSELVLVPFKARSSGSSNWLKEES